jgi:hypothetical protein
LIETATHAFCWHTSISLEAGAEELGIMETLISIVGVLLCLAALAFLLSLKPWWKKWVVLGLLAALIVLIGFVRRLFE